MKNREYFKAFACVSWMIGAVLVMYGSYLGFEWYFEEALR